jgi:hypothetical protein
MVLVSYKPVDNPFQWLIRQCEEGMMVLGETAFYAAEGDPTNLIRCRRSLSSAIARR